LEEGATIFALPTREPERFGIVELGDAGEVLSVEEKPPHPRSDLAIPGVYFFDGSAGERAAELRPSERGETEICDLMESYRAEGLLRCQSLGRGFVWLDAGTPEGLLEAGNFVATMEKRTGYEVACLEEIAWRAGWLDDAALAALAAGQVSARRRDYLLALLAD
jgi:glucose-1-phosphate thymidylyltransferase